MARGNGRLEPGSLILAAGRLALGRRGKIANCHRFKYSHHAQGAHLHRPPFRCKSLPVTLRHGNIALSFYQISLTCLLGKAKVFFPG